MNKFKVGDKVVCLHVGGSGALVMGDTYTVLSIGRSEMKVKELILQHPTHSYLVSQFGSEIETRREEVENALAVMTKYDIRRFALHPNVNDRGYKLNERQFPDKDSLLDHMFPKKNKELEALKEKAKELQASIEALEKSL